jgi:hypothetical protein
MTSIIHTNRGILAMQGETLFLLTPCCGTRTTTNGTACNSCGRPVDPFYGKTANTDDLDDAAQFIIDARAFLNNTH